MRCSWHLPSRYSIRGVRSGQGRSSCKTSREESTSCAVSSANPHGEQRCTGSAGLADLGVDVLDVVAHGLCRVVLS